MATQSVTVISGVEKIVNGDLAGKTVGQIRTAFSDILNIPASATALVNGDSVSDSHTLELGDELVFSRVLGSKG